MKKSLFTTRMITLYGLGIALFVVLGCVAPIPIPNTTAHIDLGYVVMAVFAYLFGGILHKLYCNYCAWNAFGDTVGK